MKTTYLVMVDGGASYKGKSLAEARKDPQARVVHEYRNGVLSKSITLVR